MWGNNDNIDVNEEMRKMRENNNNLMKMNSNENSSEKKDDKNLLDKDKKNSL